MLRVSDLVDAMPPGPARDAAVDHLYAGQSNDCYWHGLFGGIYLPDLRVAALRRLILAEDLALGGPGAPVESGLLVDLDLDGAAEALLVGDGQIVGVKIDEGGGIGRWDLRAAGHPLAAVMRRRPEAYHEKLRAHDRADARRRRRGRRPASRPTDRPASIHDIVTTKQDRASASCSSTTTYERRSGLVRLLPLDDDAARRRRRHRASDLVDTLTVPWELDRDRRGPRRAALARPGRSSSARTIAIGGGRLDPTLVGRGRGHEHLGDGLRRRCSASSSR